MPLPLVLLLHLAAAAAGALAGVLGSFLHASRMLGVPLGLPAALVLVAVVLGGAGAALASRTGAVAAAAGWVAVVLVLSSPRPEGDLVVPGSTLGTVWLVAGMLVAGAAVALPYARPGPRRTARAATAPPSDPPDAGR